MTTDRDTDSVVLREASRRYHRGLLLMASGTVAALVLTLCAARWGWGTSRVVLFAGALGAAVLAMAVAGFRAKLGGSLGFLAVLTGIAVTVPYGSLVFWLVPGILLGIGSAYVAGAHPQDARGTSAIAAALIAGVVLAVVAGIFGFTAGSVGVDRGLSGIAPFLAEVSALVAFLAAAVMLRRLRAGGFVIVAALLIYTFAVVTCSSADLVIRVCGWVFGAAPLVMSAATALRDDRSATGSPEEDGG